jgi:hypothetical protein
MNERTKIGIEILEAAILLGILGDTLLRVTPWGLNVPLWIGGVAAASLVLMMRWRGVTWKSESNWLYAPLIFFAAAFAWRDSPALKFFDFVAVIVALSLFTLHSLKLKVRLAGMLNYAYASVVATFSVLFGPFVLLMSDIQWKTIPRNGLMKHFFAVLRGLAIAAPLFLIFGALFVAADAVFAGLVQKTFNFNGESFITHILLMSFLTWIIGGYLRGVTLGLDGLVFDTVQPVSNDNASSFGLNEQGSNAFAANETTASGTENNVAINEAIGQGQANAPNQINQFISLGIVEISIVLGLLNALFLSFVIVQIGYFFGGAELVRATTNLTYAEYARRGFFELVTVAALALPILLAAHWLLKKENPLHEKIFRALAGAKVALLSVIMASAVKRMMLYQSEYGQTELRVYTTAFMFWLALVFGWFVLTVLRGQRERFVCGALVASFLVLGGLHVLNPDDYIVRVNAQRALEGKTFDARYASWLSADAVPALADAMPSMRHENRCIIANSFLERLRNDKTNDFRSWSLSRSKAKQVLHEQRTKIQSFGCPEYIPEPSRLFDDY